MTSSLRAASGSAASARLTADANYTYSYDNESDLVSRTATSTGKVTRYIWNADHQLLGVTAPDGSQTTFGYDPLGRRVDVTTSCGRTHTVYDGLRPIAQYDANGNLAASYVYGPGAYEQLEEAVGGSSY
ncbi:MAG TPA: RHS repeat domain-containing protein [Mycobacteriales bacterium]|nr:RHS repeat domain-containing protein [Mycobacteriales bacterium]